MVAETVSPPPSPRPRLLVTPPFFFNPFLSLPPHVSAAQLLSYPGKNKIPLNYHIVEVPKLLWQPSGSGDRRARDGIYLVFLFAVA